MSNLFECLSHQPPILSPVSVLEQLNLLNYVSRQGFARQMISFTSYNFVLQTQGILAYFFTTLDILLFTMNILSSVSNTWSFFAADTPCQLHCKPENKFFSVMMRDIVIDGTPCKAGTRNMCISGRCRVWFSPQWYESTTKNFNVHFAHKDVLIKTVASEHQLHFMHCNFLHSCMIFKYCFLSFRYSLYIYTCTMLLYILFLSYLSILDATGE